MYTCGQGERMVIAGRATKCAVYACVARAAIQTTSRHGPRKTDGGALLQVSNAHFKQSERRARQLGRIAQTSPWIAVHFDRCFGALHTYTKRGINYTKQRSQRNTTGTSFPRGSRLGLHSLPARGFLPYYFAPIRPRVSLSIYLSFYLMYCQERLRRRVGSGAARSHRNV